MAELFDRLQAAVGHTYRLESELGGGGMSRVFLAEETALHRKVVIKLLPPDTAAGVNKERFEREIQLSASLQHPHVVSLLTTGSHEDLLWYVMPFIEGESLRAKLAREGELPIGETLKILREVSDALAYAHRHEVVHRDIKPDNVMLTEGHAVVTDFGVAKAVSASSGGTASSLTSMGVALGTPQYMSPEQAAADPHVDHRADIYALGALAYEMLTGRPPFVKQTPQQTLAAHVNETPEPVTSHRQSVDAVLNDLILRCLAKRPADRWQTADELRGHFEQIGTPQSGGVTPTGTAPFAAVSTGGALAAFADTPVKVAAMFGVAAAVVLLAVYGLMIALGLPDWVFVGAIVLLVIGAPIIIVTGRKEQQRAAVATTGMQVATPAGLEKHMTWRKALLGGAGAFAGLGVVAGGFMALRAAGIGPAATLVTAGVLDAQDRILIAEFDDRTQDGGIGPSITEALRIDLSQSTAIELVDRSNIEAALGRMNLADSSTLTLDRAREMAEREGIKAIVAGEIGEIGSAYFVSGRLLSGADGTELAALRENASSPDELIDAVDRLSKALRERIGESLKTIRSGDRLARVTTTSLEALRLYTRSARINRETGEFREPIRLLEEAVALDSNFAMAYRRIDVLLGNSGGDPTRRAEVTDRLFELRDRLPPIERHLAGAAYYTARRNYDLDRVLAEYAAVLDIDPEHSTALNNSAVLLRDTPGRMAEAEHFAQRVVDGRPLQQGFQNLMVAQIGQRKWEEAEQTLADFIAWAPADHRGPWTARVNFASSRLDYRTADSVATVAEVVSNGVRRTIYQTRGKFRAAQELEDIERERAARDGRLGAQLSWALDRVDRALSYEGNGPAAEAFDEVLETVNWEQIPPLDRPLFPVAYIAAELGRVEYFYSIRSEMEARTVVPSPVGDAVWEAVTAVAEQRFVDAAEAYLRANRGVGMQSYFLGDAARAYDRAGVTDSTLSVYQRFVDAPDGFRRNSDADALPIAYRRLGELYEDRGDRENALEFYGRFVELWEEADPELQPIVDDIRGRIARLAGER